MKVRVTREPSGVVDGMCLGHYRMGRVYDVSAELAEYLVAEGCADVEMRRRQRSARARTEKRRRSAQPPLR